MDNTLEEAKAILKKYNQEHLLNGYEKLEEKKQKQLLNQIMNIDFELIKSLYDNTKKENSTNDDKIEPMEYLDKYKLNDKYKYYENIGKQAIKEGKLAADKLINVKDVPKDQLIYDPNNVDEDIWFDEYDYIPYEVWNDIYNYADEGWDTITEVVKDSNGVDSTIVVSTYKPC